ncbi:hypothetical protein N7478_008294 [Penicillium angulare]|uniref:uncharacterized protein n=1 Tax=Penicillium angulare TaxID=116970 RepID=UPI00254048F4|nr:uncharacterized protein N7478_008294 [Penicillium angulare]KAJ5273169.1 hypothetical protein N7478_008294 [Penicillium angulare]
MEVRSTDAKNGCASCGVQFNHQQAEEPPSLRVASTTLGFGLDTTQNFQPQHPSSKFDTALFEPFFADFESWSPLQPSELALRPTQSTDGREMLEFMDPITCASPGFAQSGLSQEYESIFDSNSVALANHSMELIFRVLRTWPQMLAEGFQDPPIFHSTQLSSQAKLPRPLATCITLAKMWHGQCPGAEDMVRATILQELDQVIKKSEESDEEMLLASLQAVVMYTIILLSPSADSQNERTNDDIVFRKVEFFVWHVVRGGLFLSEERAQTRPSWVAWIHVTSKRRAILTLYLLHWAYSVLHKVPCFDCRDLGFMPAPAPKALWQAHTEHEWNTKYILWLGRWSGHIYLQAEFGHISPGAVLSTRAERWLGEADEFAFIMASIRKSFL